MNGNDKTQTKVCNKKKKIIIWGAGERTRRLLHYLDYDQIEIIGFTDNSGKTNREENFLWGYSYIPKREALQEAYDYIVIGCMAYCDVTNQLLYEGIQREKIIQAYNAHYGIPDTLYFYNSIETDEGKYSVFKSIDCLVDFIV